MSPEARRNVLRPRIVDRTVVLVGILGVIFGGIAIASTVTEPEPIVPWTIEFVLGVTPAAGLIYRRSRPSALGLALEGEGRTLR